MTGVRKISKEDICIPRWVWFTTWVLIFIIVPTGSYLFSVWALSWFTSELNMTIIVGAISYVSTIICCGIIKLLLESKFEDFIDY